MSAGSAAVIAKARSKYGKTLTLSDYKSLMVKNDVNDIVTALKAYPDFKKELASISDTAVRRGQAEEMMNKRLFRIYMDLCRFKFGKKGGFYYYLVKQEEVKQIISAAMYISADAYETFILSFPVFLTEYCSFDIMALTKARSFGEMLIALKGTPYYDILKALPVDGGRFPQIRSIERALGMYYQTWLLDTVKKEFSGSERDEIEKCILRGCDIYNLKLCYRLKGLFKLSNDDVMSCRIPYHYRFSEKNMSELLEKADSEPVLPLILRHPYFKSCRDIEGIDFETAVKKANQRFFSEKLTLSQYDSVVMYSLMELLAIENANLTTVIEGVRYSLASEEIEKMLII